MRVETNLNSSIIQLAQKLSEGGLRVSDMLVILTPALKAGGEITDEKEIKNILSDSGTVDAIKACADILSKAISPKGDEGNEQEAAQS